MMTHFPKSKISGNLLTGILTMLLAAQWGCRSNEQTDSSALTDAKTVTPQALAQTLSSTSAMPHVVHVGFAALYSTNHIPGSTYAGPAAEQRGIDKLMEATRSLPKDANIVLYCGCCPWQNCPNVHPAFAALAKAGYTKVRVLKIDDNLQTDWIDKGYPITR